MVSLRGFFLAIYNIVSSAKDDCQRKFNTAAHFPLAQNTLASSPFSLLDF